MHRPRRKPRGHTAPLIATAAAGAVGFAATTTLVARRKTRWLDARTRQSVSKRHRPAARAVVKGLGYSGKSFVHGPAAALLAQYLKHRGAGEGGRAVNLASTLSATASKTFDWVLHKRVAPPGRHSVTEPSYPSGHTLEVSAVALTAAYVLWREGYADARVALPVALGVSVASGLGRLYLDRHWTTDIIGGLFAGTAVAAVCAAGYETRR